MSEFHGSLYGEYYTEHYLKEETDEKGDPMQRIIPATRALQCALPKADMICVRENGDYVSTDSFKYCARVIHNELRLGFNYHSLRHPYVNPTLKYILIEKDFGYILPKSFF